MQQNNIERIYCHAQNYAWGMLSSDPDCLVYKLSRRRDDQVEEQPKPYAEFWMGSHPSLPSFYGNGQKLHINLPYLFKVLSINQPLSIQIHPNKEQAVLLHKAKPNWYPDDNHKPEMALAITEFEALIGFAEQKIIIENLEKNPLIIKEVGEGLWNQFKEAEHNHQSVLLKDIITKFLSLTQNQIKTILDNYTWPTNCNSSLQPNKPISNYDVGYLFILIMNHVKLEKGQAVLLEAGLIHSYLKGSIIEVMANSDNVVRCGFTPKEKDIETMKEILICAMEEPRFVVPIKEQNKLSKHDQYITKYKEFACEYLELEPQIKSAIFWLKENTILLCIKGEGKMISNDEECELNFGSTYLIANTTSVYFSVQSELELYCCNNQ